MKDLEKLAKFIEIVGLITVIVVLIHSSLFFSPKYSRAVEALRIKQEYDLSFLDTTQSESALILFRNGYLFDIANLTGISDILKYPQEMRISLTDREIAESIMGRLWPLAIIGANMPFLAIYCCLIIIGLMLYFLTLKKEELPPP